MWSRGPPGVSRRRIALHSTLGFLSPPHPCCLENKPTLLWLSLCKQLRNATVHGYFTLKRPERRQGLQFVNVRFYEANCGLKRGVRENRQDTTVHTACPSIQSSTGASPNPRKVRRNGYVRQRVQKWGTLGIIKTGRKADTRCRQPALATPCRRSTLARCRWPPPSLPPPRLPAGRLGIWGVVMQGGG